MLRVVIANVGGGKTYLMKREIAGKCYSSKRETYIVEKEGYPEYSDIFGGKSVHVLNSGSELSFLKEKKSCDIYVDCEHYTDESLEKLDRLCRFARVDDNNITIAFLDCDVAYIQSQSTIFMNANEVYVGRCDTSNEQMIETMFGENIKPLETDFIDDKFLRSLKDKPII